MRLSLFAIALFALTASPVFAQLLSHRALTQQIDAIVGDSAFANAWWAVHVVDPASGEVIYSHNANKSFIPASNTKLYTTYAALQALGPDFRYETPLYYSGTIQDGVLYGNLIIRGSGDPTIGGRFNDGDRTAAFRSWASALKQLGITRIEGDIIGDDDFFDEQALGYGWSWDDELFYYSAETGALSFNDNCIDFALEATTQGAPTQITWEPHNTSFVQVHNTSRTIDASMRINENYDRPREANTFTLGSLVPEGQTDFESLTVHNPTRFFLHIFRDVLLAEGFAHQGDIVDIDEMSIKPSYANPGLTLVAKITSPPLAEIIKVVNKNSQNFYAEQLLKTLGAFDLPLPLTADEELPNGSAARGIEVSRSYFGTAGVDTSRIQLVDGSGLARQNLVTATMTTDLLHAAWSLPDSSYTNTYLRSLAIGGQEGTLRSRFNHAEAPVVYAKTGTVGNASALSGFMNPNTSRPLIFAIMVNHYTVPTRNVRAAQDRIIIALDAYSIR
ncbi:MAG: D-alanyl-D-alanine carboxypeptidase/D-alanyl-D-alanine-endopeptidase [Rhodothermales bacterium]